MMTQRGGIIALITTAAACLGGALAAPTPAATGPAASLSAASTAVLPCGGPDVTVNLTDSANFHGLFATYGNNQPTGSFNGWTAGDTDYSVTLPDGRRVWDFTDAQLGTVQLNSSTGDYEIVDGGTSHNVAVLEQPDNGPMYATLHSSQTFPGSSNWFLGWIPEPSSADNTSQHTPFFNPHAMTVERDAATGSTVVRAVGIYGGYSVDDESFVATFNLGSHLTLQNVAYIPAPQAVANANRGILWGDALIQQGGYTYIYGEDNQTSNVPFFFLSSAYLARVPAGELNQPSRWTYFNGNFTAPGWTSDPQQAQPIIPRGGTYPCETGVVPTGAGYSAAELNGTFYVFTRDPNATGSITAYASPNPWGPWSGPTEDDPSNGQFGFYTPPVPANCPSDTLGCTYGPHIHADVAADSNGWLLSYDVNTSLQDRAANIEDYRPKFLRIQIP